jgi:hypothetical protein
MLLQVGGFNLSLVMRKLIGRGTPRACKASFQAFYRPWSCSGGSYRAFGVTRLAQDATTDHFAPPVPRRNPDARCGQNAVSTTSREGWSATGHRVKAAIELPWSNGRAEGHVHRIKLIKRKMYGGANVDLLRMRVMAEGP